MTKISNTAFNHYRFYFEKLKKGSATFYHDEIIVRPYRHRRSEWLAAANARIKEFRTTPVNINIEDCVGCTAVVKMNKNGFPFGATYNKHMYDDEENTRNKESPKY